MEKYINQQVVIRNEIMGVVERVDAANKFIYIVVNGSVEEYSIYAIKSHAIVFVDSNIEAQALEDFGKDS